MENTTLVETDNEYIILTDDKIYVFYFTLDEGWITHVYPHVSRFSHTSIHAAII